jgi:hypothetical protein
MIGYTLPEIRKLLINLIQSRTPRPPARLVLVHLAPTTPAPGPALPLPSPRLLAHLSAVAVLSINTTKMGPDPGAVEHDDRNGIEHRCHMATGTREAFVILSRSKIGFGR